jgi:hypothetical protein
VSYFYDKGDAAACLLGFGLLFALLIATVIEVALVLALQ